MPARSSRHATFANPGAKVNDKTVQVHASVRLVIFLMCVICVTAVTYTNCTLLGELTHVPKHMSMQYQGLHAPGQADITLTDSSSYPQVCVQ